MDFIKKSKLRVRITFILLIITLVVAFLFCIGFGSVKIGIKEVVEILFNKNNRLDF